MKDSVMANEMFTNGFNYNFLIIISFASVVCGILVITSKNPIVSVLFLIGLFFNISGYLMMLGVNFIGLSYLLVYVGAVSILFLFILMLINVRISELVTDNNNGVPLGIIIGITFNLILHRLLPSNFTINEDNFIINNMEHNNINTHELIYNDSYNISYLLSNIFNLNYDKIFFVTSHIWDGVLAQTSHITSIGNVIYTVYPIWLILTSIILLLAMVGAIVITIKQ